MEFLTMMISSVMFAYIAYRLAGYVLKKTKMKIFTAWTVFIFSTVMAFAGRYFCQLVYEYDGRVGLHPHELPLERPIFIYVLQGAIFGFFILFGITVLNNGIKQRKFHK